jgi:hypothetical protein
MMWAISFVAAVTFAVHAFVGGPRVAGPLLADTCLPKAAKWLNYYCWHIVTILLAFMVGAFAWLAVASEPAVSRAALYFFGSLSLALSTLSIAVALKGGIHPLRFPSTTLFALIALLCGLAVS